MKAQQLIEGENSAFGPEQMRVIGEAFDGAWRRIASDVGTRPQAIEAARLKLAQVVLRLARNGITGSDELREASLKVMFSDPTEL